MKRTPDIVLDKSFEVTVPISKAYVDSKTGERHIIGVASGVLEDRDGERVSRRALVEMARQVSKGGVKLTASHQQDWMTEIGDAVTAKHDDKTDELMIDTQLPPEGVDAIADKAWKTANQDKVGFSIGGKLLSSFFEKNELGKKRKVLDSIGLKHFCLTKNPSYANSFAEAVAKTFTGDTPADEAFTLESDDLAKDMSTGSWAGGDSDSGGGNTSRDSVGSGQRNAGSKDPKSKGMDTEEDGDDEDKKDLPKAPDERHLACPNCGHEFAADLPLDPEERQNDDDKPAANNTPDTGKSVETNKMTPLTETLEALKALAAEEDVAKTDPEPEADEVAVATSEVDEVAKMVAASHKHHEDRFASLESKTGEGFEMVAKAVKALTDRIAEMPQGRRSVARVLPPSTGHEGDGEKSIEKQVEDADDAVSALKIQNEAIYGIR